MMVMASALIVFYSVFAYQHEKAEYAKESVSELKAITQVLENDYATLVLNGAPNLREELLRKWQQFPVLEHADLAGASRSEERRVGTECRFRWGGSRYTTNK